MKGVCAPGDASRRKSRRGPHRCGPLLVSGIFPTRNADGAAPSLLPSFVKIVHSSLKMNVNVYKLMKMNNCERF